MRPIPPPPPPKPPEPQNQERSTDWLGVEYPVSSAEPGSSFVWPYRLEEPPAWSWRRRRAAIELAFVGGLMLGFLIGLVFATYVLVSA